MKKIVSFTSVLLGIVLLIGSCKKDKCKDVICQNGTCNEGVCDCGYGWTGTLCDTKKSEVFLGFWEGELSCGAFSDTTVMKIKEVENTVDSLSMNTVGFVIEYSGFSISLDEYLLTGKINENFKTFKIGPNHLVLEKFGQKIEADITGNGELTDKNNKLKIDIDISTAITNLSCSGVFKK